MNHNSFSKEKEEKILKNMKYVSCNDVIYGRCMDIVFFNLTAMSKRNKMGIFINLLQLDTVNNVYQSRYFANEKVYFPGTCMKEFINSRKCSAIEQ